MNIYHYLDEYGKYTFEEKEFNQLDAVLFSYLSYGTFDKVFEEKRKLTIKEAATIHYGYRKGKDNNVIAVKEANELLHYIKDLNRYKNCILYHYQYIGNEETQFGVISIEYQKNKVFVSFEGTDELFSGWIEDFQLSYQFPTKAHELAINYINKKFLFQNKEIILGGHSKGGNLALIAGMYSKNYVRKKIVKIYGMDSPGLLEEQLNSIEYQTIRDRYIHIIPDYSVIGVLLKSENDIVIKSKKKGIMAHDILNWEIEGTQLKKGELSPLSKEISLETDKWNEKYNKEDKLEFVTNLNETFKKANVKDIIEIKEQHKKIITIISESKKMTEKAKTMIKDLISIMIKSYRDTKIEEIKQAIGKNIRIMKKPVEKQKENN